MSPRWKSVVEAALLLVVADWWTATTATAADESPEVAAVAAAAEVFLNAFNSGEASAVTEQFIPRGEFIDEEGNLYQGRENLQKLFTQYFAKFPQARLGLEIESIRVIGDNLAIEEGTRFLSTKENGKAQVRYITVRSKLDGKWMIASIREFYDDPLPTPGERLSVLDWLVGDWVSEGEDAAVRISYRWSEDRNFLLGDYRFAREGKVAMKSSQRIGWDPTSGKVRSWLFESDGGFAEGIWTLVEDAWVIKSVATLADGTTGTATISIKPQGKH